MFAVILTGGKQYKVKEGEKIKIEMLNIEEGKSVNFDKVLMFVDETGVKIGTPYVKDAVVQAEVTKHGRHKKISIIKFKRRKHHMKHAGHRQYYTEVEIQKLPGKQPAAKKTVKVQQKNSQTEKAVKKPVTQKPETKKITAAKAEVKKPTAKKATSKTTAKKPVTKKAAAKKTSKTKK